MSLSARATNMFVLSRAELLSVAQCLYSVQEGGSYTFTYGAENLTFLVEKVPYPYLQLPVESTTITINLNECRDVASNLDWLSKAKGDDDYAPHFHLDCSFWDEKRQGYVNRDVVFQLADD